MLRYVSDFYDMALLAIMVVDIQREYRFYSEKVEIRLQKNMDIRRKYVGIARRGTPNAKSPGGGIGLVWMTSGFGAGYGC